MGFAIGQTPHSMAARDALHGHRSIRDHFAPDLFAEPAREALLQMFIAREEGLRLSMLALSRQCSVSESTGLRWIARLEARGYCERVADHQDHRRSWIVMTDEGCSRMRAWLDTHWASDGDGDGDADPGRAAGQPTRAGAPQRAPATRRSA